MREIEDNINRWQDIPCSWIRRVATAKMTLLLKAVYRFSAVSIKIPMAVSTALEQRNVRFCMEIQKGPELTKQSWERTKLEESHFLTSHYTAKATAIKALVQKQMWKSTAPDRKPRNNATHIRPVHLQQMRWEYTVEKSQVSSIRGAGKTGELHVNMNL